VNNDLHFDYTTIGHVTIDVLEDGSRRAGGSAFYSALQASRLGRRALIITRGVPEEIEQALAAHRHELKLQVLPATHTTTLSTVGVGPARTQRVLAWAGPIEDACAVVDTSILHLAPVARESAPSWSGRADFVGLTPQGLARTWSEGPDGPDSPAATMTLAAPTAAGVQLAAGCNALVVNDQERAFCAELIAAANGAGATVAITAGERPSTILAPDGSALELEVPPLPGPLDDLGAGDVFAAAFFIALADGRPAQDAARFANAAAAVRMQGLGADAIGGLEAIEARMQREAKRQARR
jgi:sugar/nucleoside kinase (ribokinase family)